MTAEDSPHPRGPNCWQCRFFAVSWDPRMPYACQRLGFKTPVLPAIEVLRIDGQHCRGFAPKANAPTPAPTPASAAAAKAKPETPPTATRPSSTRLWQA